MSIYKKCDIRGRFGDELTIHHATRLGMAIASLGDPDKVLVGGDGRTSTAVLKNALICSLINCGCTVIDLGMISTPAFYFARRRLGIQTGVMVTASHNPAEDNGFKIALGELPISPEDINEIARKMEDDSTLCLDKTGILKSYNIMPEYLADLLSLSPHLQGLKVIVDCSNGMASLTAEKVWQSTDADVKIVLNNIDGRFPVHAPNPAVSNNLAYLMNIVTEERADLGICYDGDADRVAFIDDQARVVSNDKVIVLFAQDALKNGAAPIVFDQKCSRIVPESIRKMGGEPILEQSGHTFIKTAFLKHSAPYAGEITGHHFFKEILGDDAIVSSLLFTKILSQSKQKLSSLLKQIPEYAITPEIRIPMNIADINRVLARIESQLESNAHITHLDGLRIEYSDSWCLLRQSVTEQMMTARFEGSTPQALTVIIDQISSVAPELSQFFNQFRKTSREDSNE